MNCFDHIYGLKFERADVCMFVYVLCIYGVNSPQSTSILIDQNTERLLMVTGFVTPSSAVGVNVPRVNENSLVA